MNIDAAKVKNLMAKNLMTQIGLAKAAGVSRATINMTLAKGSCSTDTASKICNALNITPVELVGSGEQRKVLTYDIGYYSYSELEKLRSIFNGDQGREGIVVNADINVPDWNNLVITLESERYTDKVKMLDMFSSILAVELIDRL